MSNTLCDCDWPGIPAQREQSQNYDLWSQIGCVRHSPGTHESRIYLEHTTYETWHFALLQFFFSFFSGWSQSGHTNNVCVCVWFHFSPETHEAGIFSNSISVRCYAWIINDWTVNGRALSRRESGKNTSKIFQPINFGRLLFSSIRSRCVNSQHIKCCHRGIRNFSHESVPHEHTIRINIWINDNSKTFIYSHRKIFTANISHNSRCYRK